MESAFDADFSGVRIHTGDSSSRLNNLISARAFTTGQDIFFGAGHFAPGSPGGDHVLAHELAHTLQPQPPSPAVNRSVAPARHDGAQIRRTVQVGARLFSQAVPQDVLDFPGVASATASNQVLAGQLGQWMLSQPSKQNFNAPEGLTKYVNEMVDAIEGTKPSYRIGDAPAVESAPAFPAAAAFKGRGRKLLVKQGPQERGDMHDVRAAMMLEPRLHVAVRIAESNRLADGAAIIDYYRGFPGRVRLDTKHKLPDDYKPESASEATDILFEAAKKRSIAGDLQAATTGGTHNDYQREYDQVLTKFHFPADDRAYLLVNFRVSGHGVPKPRQASHPELDTGIEGFGQLWKAAKDMGYWPVPVGAIPQSALVGCTLPNGEAFDPASHPNLVEYYRMVGPVHEAIAAKARAALVPVEPAAEGEPAEVRPDVPPAPSKRQVEYGIFGRLAARFPKTRAIGMRSGGLDAIAFAGIPTISVDIAVAENDPLKDTVGKFGHIGSWQRAAKREIILPGQFHQLFMDALRPVGDAEDASWAGALKPVDIQRATVALTTFFGAAGDAGTHKRSLKSQPTPKNVKSSSVVHLINKLATGRNGGEVVIDAELAQALGIKDPAVPDV